MATTGILRAGYHPLDDFTEHTQSQIWTGSGAPICWQATATVDGKPWRDSGSGPCPPVVRVPRGARDIIVTDDGLPASPRIQEG